MPYDRVVGRLCSELPNFRDAKSYKFLREISVVDSLLSNDYININVMRLATG